MGRWVHDSFLAKAASIVLVFTMTLAASPLSAPPRDRRPPTTPGNLRVAATTSYSVALSWSASSDDSGSFSYRIHASNGQEASVGQGSLSFTFTSGLLAGYSYSFYVYAVDGAGNRSARSNTVSAVLPADHNPPTAPVLSVTGVAPTRVSLAWTPSVDDGPYVYYQTYVNGAPHRYVPGNTSADVTGLAPSTTYVFTVVAGDTWNNMSPLSNASPSRPWQAIRTIQPRPPRPPTCGPTTAAAARCGCSGRSPRTTSTPRRRSGTTCISTGSWSRRPASSVLVGRSSMSPPMVPTRSRSWPSTPPATCRPQPLPPQILSSAISSPRGMHKRGKARQASAGPCGFQDGTRIDWGGRGGSLLDVRGCRSTAPVRPSRRRSSRR